MATVDRLATQGIADSQYLHGWDLSPFDKGAIAMAYLREMVLRPNLKEFMGTYQLISSAGDVRFVTLAGQLPEFPAWLQQIVRANLGAINQYNIDLSLLTGKAEERAVAALRSIKSQTSGLNPTIILLNRTGFYPLEPLALGVKPSSPLFRTPEGRTRSAEMLVTNEIFSFAKYGDLPQVGEPSDVLKSAIPSIWKPLKDKVDHGCRKIRNQPSTP